MTELTKDTQMDGLTCTRKIRELEAEGKLTGHVPIIAVTANARQEQIQTALDAGMVRAQPLQFVLVIRLTCSCRTTLSPSHSVYQI